MHGLGPHTGGKLGRANDVAEHYGDELVLAFKRRTRGQDFLDEMRRRVGDRTLKSRCVTGKHAGDICGRVSSAGLAIGPYPERLVDLNTVGDAL